MRKYFASEVLAFRTEALTVRPVSLRNWVQR